MLEQSGVSRRRLLTFAGLTMGSAVVDIALPGSPAEAAPQGTPDDLVVKALADDPVTVVSAGAKASVATVPRQLAVQVRNSGTALAAGSRLTVTYDSRLYEAVQPVGLVLAGRTVAGSSSTVRNEDTGAMVCTVTLGEAIPARAAGEDALVVVVGTARPVRYPRDLVHAAQGAAATVPATKHTPHVHRDLYARSGPARGTEATPWGIELAGGWSPWRWGPNGTYLYYWPAQVTLRNVGPGAAPIRAGFSIAVDPRVVSGLSVTGLRLNGKTLNGDVARVAETRTSAVYESHWQTPVRLKDGGVLDVLFTATTLDPGGPLPTIKYPVVTLTGLGDDPARRDTGNNTLSRLDAVYQP